MSTYDKDAKSHRVKGTYVTVAKESKFDSGLFKAACIVMVLGFPWMAMAIALWQVPWMWEQALSSYAGWGWGELAILLTGFCLLYTPPSPRD